MGSVIQVLFVCLSFASITRATGRNWKTQWDLSLYFRGLYTCNRWVLASQQKALGPCKCAWFRAMQTYRNYSFSCLLTFVSIFKRLLVRKKAFFLKIRSYFSFNFFPGPQLINSLNSDSEFHGHWTTVTLSSISPNLIKHWRFLTFGWVCALGVF